MNPLSQKSEQKYIARANFFENMCAAGINDEVFLNWFWNNKYAACEGALLLSVALMYEGWKGAKAQ